LRRANSGIVRGRRFMRGLELRLALFEEGAHAFAAILRLETLELLVHFVLESLDQFVALVAVENLLDGLNGDVRTISEFAGQRPCSGVELRGRNNPIDDAKIQRRFRVDHFAGIKQFGGFGRPNNLWKEIRAPVVRKEADVDEVLAEGGGVGSDAQISRERDV